MNTGAEGFVSGVPRRLTSFVGRRTELELIRRLLSSQTRLVTLTGPAGVGKSRIASTLASSLGRSVRDGVWFMDLVGGTSDVAEVAARALKVAGPGDAVTAVTQALGDRSVLLVFDNCDQSLGDAARFVSQLLRSCENARVLATSREPLGVESEILVQIDPLASGPEPISSPAVRLFVERAQQVLPGYEPTSTEASTIASLCDAVGGLPLAIELAAGRLDVLGLTTIATRAETDLSFLRSGARADSGSPASLRSSLEQSWTHCGTAEKRMWSALSALPDGWDLQLGERLAQTAGFTIPDADEALFGLVRKSVVHTMREPDGTRYGMLPPVMHLAREQLTAPDAERLGAAHADLMLTRLQEAEGTWMSPQQSSILARLRGDLPQLRTAIAFCSSTGRGDTAMRLALTAFRQCWQVHGDFEELGLWITRALATEEVPAELAACGHALRSVILQFGRRQHQAEAAIAVAREVNPGTPLSDAVIAAAAAESASDDDAVDLFRRSIDLQGADAFDYGRLNTPSRLAIRLYRAGRDSEADALIRGIHERCEAASDRFESSYLDLQLATIALRRGDVDHAEQLARDAIERKRGLNNPLGIAYAEEVLAAVAHERALPKRAAILLGAAVAQWRSTGAIPTSSQPFFTARDTVSTALRQRLADPSFEAAVAEGMTLTEDLGIDFALDSQATDHAGPAQRAPSTLTRRELQIAQLVAEGLGNKAIATKLFISVRTVEAHIENALVRLGMRSRTELAVWVREQSHQTDSGLSGREP